MPSVSRRGKITIAVVGGIVLFLIFLNQLVGLWTDWLWFEEVDYTEVFGGVIRTRIWLFLLFGLVMGGFVGGNLYLAFRLRPMARLSGPDQQALERYRMLLSPRFGLWTALAGGVVGLFAGLSAQANWQLWMLFQNRVDFGTVDPEFNIDVGYYVFELPFWRYLLDMGFSATAPALLGALAVHYLYGGVRLQGPGDRMSVGARAQLTGLVALFVLLKAAAYFLDRRTMLLEFNGGTDTWGAGYTDINAVLPAKEILAYISIVVAIAILIFSNVGARNLVWAGASLALLGVSAVAIGGIYPLIVEQVTVNPNRPSREADYIERSIHATRAAFGFAEVDRTQYTSDVVDPPDSLVTDTTVVPTVRLLDPAVVNETFTQYQQIRSFYTFPEKLDVDRYQVNGRLQDFVVGVRELDYRRLSGQATNWQNRHTVFTHGYGFVAAPANTTCRGEPFFVSGILVQSQSGQGSQCVAATDAISVSQPRIYYGELFPDGDFVVVGKPDGAADPEFDRPQGESQENYTYTGSGGIPISSMTRRLLYGLHFWDANFLLFDGFNENSKILYNRNPRDRVEKVAPFLTLDGDPYPAVIDGRVVWILDGYTTSSNYPYSQMVDLRQATSDALSDRGTVLQARQNVNYMRNSVKATVDAYDGTVTLYAFDESDPVLRAWNQAFGGDIIKPHSEIPAELAAHFRYPEDLFKVQRDLLSKFHVSNPVEFNNGQDFWAVPNDPASSTGGATSIAKQPPYYLLTQFPGVNAPRFQLTSALTPVNRQNLAALLTGVVTDDGLKLEMLELPREGRIPGPGQAQQQMITNNEVITEITLLSGQGAADIIYGNLLSLPYAGGLLYVQPVYLKSGISTQIPLMRLVLVSYGNYVSFAPTLTEAISKLVEAEPSTDTPPPDDEEPPPTGTPTAPPPTTTPPVVPPPGDVVMTPALQAALDRLDAAIVRVEQAQTSGDFAAYGAALAELQAAMDDYQAALAAARSAQTTAPPTPA